MPNTFPPVSFSYVCVFTFANWGFRQFTVLLVNPYPAIGLPAALAASGGWTQAQAEDDSGHRCLPGWDCMCPSTGAARLPESMASGAT